MEKLLFGLGIRHVGSKAAKTLAREFGTMEVLSKASREELTAINEIGDKMADSIVAYFELEEVHALLNELDAAGVNLTFKGQRAVALENNDSFSPVKQSF
ncbi:hypothetical protein KEH51_11415 [[Brevibacterium] frigoritolerans]|uniref:DisA/LigA helix-hairpin-helix motif domain-containing protein n=1 Tax=Peribacillus frigoritolerans TaxID=450367 RepID=A0A941FQF7_9BACI|nr:hypothetical protein [Peribacillus frigoritolerans]